MNILFDLISTQGFINGGGEYTKTIFLELVKRSASQNINIFGLYDSTSKFAFNDLQLSDLNSIDGLTLIDVHSTPIQQIVSKFKIDKFFIGIAQKIAKVCDFKGLDVPTICVIHDMAHQESQIVGFSMYLSQDSFLNYTKEFLLKHYYEERRHVNIDLFRLIDTVIESKGFFVTVSDYSKNSIEYLTKIKEEQIKVFYSPLKSSKIDDSITNKTLGSLIAKKDKYFLAVSANRPLKNVRRALNAYKRLTDKHNCDVKFVTVGYNGKPVCDGHIILPYLSESDLEYAYKNCYALVYTSFLEGFGYPPIEVMKFGRAIISSNVCSMPEILGEAPLYVSPFYETDIYRAMKAMLNKDVHDHCAAKCRDRFKKVSERQEEDLNKLINLILAKVF